LAESSRSGLATSGPESVKTLSYLECVNQAFLSDAIAQAFVAISTTDVPKRLWSRFSAFWSREKPRRYAAIAFSKPAVPMSFITL